jgi:DNA-binding response OmpR family regulator/HPt (histidine-containing phosphotransfer) domain-containing protein
VKILLVEDDQQLSGVLAAQLREQHYIVDTATDGQLGWELVQSAEYNLVILDIDLPKLNGIKLCQQLRDRGYTMPVMLLTSKDTDADKAQGLDAGADDYVLKTVGQHEFAARIRALLRRTPIALATLLKWGDLQLDLASCTVVYGDRPLTLTAKEYALLELLMQNPERVFSLSTILHQLWTFDGDLPGEDTIRAHVKRLRQKLKSVGADDLLETVYGMGYRLNPAFHHEYLKQPSSPQPSQLNQPNSDDQRPANNWQSHQQILLQRVCKIETAIQRLTTENPNNRLRQQTERECHQLVGTLGALNVSAAVPILRSLESLLSAPTAPTPDKIQQLHNHIHTLHTIIETADNSNLELTLLKVPLQSAETHSTSGLPNATKVLILDDDPIMLRLLRGILEPWGLDITTLRHPVDFWQTLETVAPDLLILDVQMPGTDGVELCAAIRDRDRWAWLPIVFLTGHRDAETIQRLFSAGADDYVSKPVVAPELITRVLNRIERTQLLRNQNSVCNPKTN